MDMMVATTQNTPVVPSVAGSWNMVAVHRDPESGHTTRVPFYREAEGIPPKVPDDSRVSRARRDLHSNRSSLVSAR